MKKDASRLKNNTCICERHFAREHYTNSNMTRLNLNAFPSLFPPSARPSVHGSSPEGVTVCPPFHGRIPVDRDSKSWSEQEDLVLCEVPVLHRVVLGDIQVSSPMLGEETVTHIIPGKSPVPETSYSPPTSGECSADASVKVEGTIVEIFEEHDSFGAQGDDSSSIPSQILDEERSPSPTEEQLGEEVAEEVGLELLTKVLLSTSKNVSTVPLTDPYYKYKLCRLCFRGGNDLKYIFGMDFKQFCLKDALIDLVHLKVSKSDDYPQQICERCLPTLIKFKHFKDRFLKDKALFDEELKKLNKQVVTNRISLHESDAVMLEDTDRACSIPGSSGDVLDRRRPPADETTVATENPEGALQDEQVTKSDTDGDRADTDFSGNLEVDLQDSSIEDEVGGGDGESEMPVPLTTKGATRLGKRNPEGMLPCPHCDKVFKYCNHRNDHIKEHEKEFPLSCVYCDRRYRSLMHLNQHIVIHSNYKPFECEECGMRMRHRNSLLRHKEKHSGSDNYLCSYCGQGFRDYTVFLSHVKRIHSTTRDYVCDVCGREFHTRTRQREHVQIHHAPRVPTECDLCGKTFPSKRCMERHKWRQHSSSSSYPARKASMDPRKRKRFDK